MRVNQKIEYWQVFRLSMKNLVCLTDILFVTGRNSLAHRHVVCQWTKSIAWQTFCLSDDDDDDDDEDDDDADDEDDDDDP